MSSAPALLVDHLCKSFGALHAVDDLSFEVSLGEIVGLVGPNGAGKTTTINMILGVLAATSGRIEIEGIDLKTDRTRALSGANFAAVYAPLPGNLTVEQNLRVFGMIYDVPNLTARIDEVIEAYDLKPMRKEKAGVLSSGEQTRLSLAKAMLNKPRLLLLDEPTASIDPSTARDIRAGITAYVDTGQCAVLWTSHNMYEVEAVCDRMMFLSRGKIVLEGDPKTLAHEHGAASLDDLFVAVAHETAHWSAAAMNLRRLAAIVLRQVYLWRGSPQRVLPMFAWVALDIVLWGFITRYLNSVASAGFNFVPALLGAVLLWDFLTRVMQGVTMAFFEDVWSRNFLNVFAAPLRISEYVGGLVVTAICTSLVGLVTMIVLAWAAFGLSFLSYGAALAPFLMVLFLTGIALGITAAAIVLRLGPASEWLIWPIPTLLSPFAGVFYPVSVLPGWMQAISRVLPPAYVFDGLRAIVAGKPAPWDRLAVGAGLAGVYLVLACFAFAAVYRHAIRTGLIARYSAETVS